MLALILLMVVLIIGVMPAWPYSASWGYYPSGGILLLAVVAILMMGFNRRRGDIL